MIYEDMVKHLYFMHKSCGLLKTPVKLNIWLCNYLLSCYAFNLYNTSEQDACTTIFSRFRIIQFSCTSAYCFNFKASFADIPSLSVPKYHKAAAASARVTAFFG